MAALGFISGLLIGLNGLAHVVLPAATLAGLAAGLAAMIFDRRTGLAAAALVSLVVAGLITGLVEVRRAERDCRKSLQAGEEIRLSGHALSYLPAGERGSVRSSTS